MTSNKENKISILSLPDEIISTILVYNKPKEIIYFSFTCKRFYEAVRNNDYLWKIKYAESVPRSLLQVIKDHRHSKWNEEYFYLCKIQKKIYSELLAMSPKCYKNLNNVGMGDARPFFTIASENNLNYFYIIYFLQNIIREGNVYLDRFISFKPLYTLTVMFYAKMILRYLIHTFLAIKWIQMRIRNELPPEHVITFFLQWLDPTKIYDFDEVDKKIEELAKQVQSLLEPASKNRTAARQPPTDKQVLEAISHVIYKHESFSIASTVKTNNIDIPTVIKESHGNMFTFGAIYRAVARRFGVDCELKTFPDHLILHWRNNEEPNNALYTVDLLTGELKPKRQCPFSRTSESSDIEYRPDLLMQYIYSSYMKTEAPFGNFHTQNIVFLTNFFGNDVYDTRNQYKGFLDYLTENSQSPAFSTKLNMKYMREVHLQVLLSLSTMNTPQPQVYPKPVVKHVPSANKPMYAVGMICSHKQYNFICIIRDREPDGSRHPYREKACSKLGGGINQPFYRVLAGDRSDRLIAHEKLMAVTAPSRMTELEDYIAKEFTHFNGFYYVPNDEKSAEYPHDIAVAEEFKKRSMVTGGSYICYM